MSGKIAKIQFGSTIINEVNEMVSKGETQTEIAEFLV